MRVAAMLRRPLGRPRPRRSGAPADRLARYRELGSGLRRGGEPERRARALAAELFALVDAEVWRISRAAGRSPRSPFLREQLETLGVHVGRHEPSPGQVGRPARLAGRRPRGSEPGRSGAGRLGARVRRAARAVRVMLVGDATRAGPRRTVAGDGAGAARIAVTWLAPAPPAPVTRSGSRCGGSARPRRGSRVAQRDCVSRRPRRHGLRAVREIRSRSAIASDYPGWKAAVRRRPSTRTCIARRPPGGR